MSKDLLVSFVFFFFAGEQDIILCSSEEDESAHFIRLTVTFIDNCWAGGSTASPLPTNPSQLHSHPINTAGASVPPHYLNSMRGVKVVVVVVGGTWVPWGQRGRSDFPAETKRLCKNQARD